MSKKKMVLTALLSLFVPASAFADELPGRYSDLCRAEITQLGDGPYATYDGDWSGLEQTVILSTALISAASGTEGVILAATPGRPAWNVPRGCTVYIGVLSRGTFTATSGQRPGQTVTYRIRSNRLDGHLQGSGIENTAILYRSG